MRARTKAKSKTTQTVREQPRVVATLPEIAADALVRPLLVSRRDAAVMLGRCDVSLIKRLENMGVLHPMRLNPRSPSAQVFFDYNEIVSVARGYTQKNPQATTNDTEVVEEEERPRLRRRKSSREARADR